MNRTAIPIEKIDRTELARRIPHAGLTRIHEETKNIRPKGYHYNYVREVINGHATNLDILQIAYDLYWDNERALNVLPEHAKDLTINTESEAA